MKEVERRKNETPPYIRFDGYPHASCLRLSLAEKHFCSCTAMAPSPLLLSCIAVKLVACMLPLEFMPVRRIQAA